AARAAPGVRRVRSPSIFTRACCADSSAVSLAMNSSSSSISASISPRGRCQFSCEKAKSESTSSPHSMAPSTTSRTAFMPDRCPSGRGRLRSRAQRPFPSMMIATWRGMAPFSRIFARSSVAFMRRGFGAWSGTRASASPSHLHDFRFLRLHELVEPAHVVVVQLLQLALGVLLVVFRDPIELLDAVASGRAGVTHRDAAFLGELVHHLHQIAPPLLVQRRDRNANRPTLVGGVESQIGVANRLLDCGCQPLVPRRDDEHPWFRSRNARNLCDRQGLAIGVHAYRVEQGRRGLPTPDAGEFAPGTLRGLVHGDAAILENLGNGAHCTMVPTRSPRIALATAPGC